ncbi:hypothetical protein [Burkholderia vietnamiensis]|uniref:hypothetical protein n=1 Tax=Burkholderia vietnamiensis TaxID=60552 RepID=UPI000AEB3E45
MRVQSALLFLIGTLLAAGGYGATFLLSMRFHEMGGSDLDTGTALAAATVGTFAGLAVVGWCARLLGAARLAALSLRCARCASARASRASRWSGVRRTPTFRPGSWSASAGARFTSPHR